MLYKAQAAKLRQNFHQSGDRVTRCRIDGALREHKLGQLIGGKGLIGFDQHRKKRSVDVIEKMHRIIEAVVNDKLPVRFPPVQAGMGGESPESGYVASVRVVQGNSVRSKSFQGNR